jgi:outer membrane protein OmpA-like peptidoglycan-associated protein
MNTNKKQQALCGCGVFFFLAVSGLCGALQAAEKGRDAGLVDVVSVYNGGYAWSKGTDSDVSDAMSLVNSVVGSMGRPYFLADKKTKRKDLVYELAAPATIESFRVRGSGKPTVPPRVEFAVSSSPETGFQTIASFDIPIEYRPESLPSGRGGKRFDFSIPVKQKISAKYVRLSMLGETSFELRHFNAYGRFDQPAKLRKDFSGVYSTHKSEQMEYGAPDADKAMLVRDKTTPYIVLHQNEGQIQGCYLRSEGRELSRVAFVEGTFSGGAESNLFHFIRTYNKDGSQRPGVITLSPDGKKAHLAMLREIKPGDEYDGFYRLNLTRVSDQPIPCATNAEKEKTPVDVMAETIAKTGKVQLYGVNFDFDSDVLRPESGAVLNEVVKLAKANPNWKFEIGGHTDSQGSDTYNQNLSERRAASVVRYLTQAGVAASRLTAKGYGESRPLIPETNDSEAARAQNRRVELVKQ